jgi:Chalcone isomerase-like
MRSTSTSAHPKRPFGTRRLTLAALGAFSLAGAIPSWAQTAAAQSIKIGPVTFEPEATMGGQKLLLNGAGMRIRAIFNVYAAALYTSRKVSKNEDVLKTDLPKRMHLVSQRDLKGDEFGSLFAKAMENNASREEFAKSVTSVMKMGQVFADARDFKKGDVILVDYLPARGIIITHKGKQMGDPFVGNEFHTLMFKIWFGPKPVDEALRKALLGEQSTANSNVN